MFVVHSVERAVDQPAALLQGRQEVSLILINDVHDLQESTSNQSTTADDNFLLHQ